MYEEESVDVPPNFIAALIKKRWYLITIIPILILISGSIVVMIPPIYRSEGRVVVETQTIPEELVRSTVTSIASERIAIIQQRVMTRDNLLQIVNKYEFLRPGDETELAIAKKLKLVRDNIYVDVVETTTGSRAKPVNTIAFSVGFEAESPFVAQAVANDLMTLFLNENVKARTQRASETTEFLRSEGEKIKQSLERTEAEIAKFKQENKDALPEHLGLYVDIRERAQRKLSDISREIRSVQEQRKLFQTQLSLANESNIGLGADEERLIELQRQYDQLLLTYRSEHPDVIALKEQIDMLRKVESVSDGSEKKKPYSRAQVELNQQLVDLDTRQNSLMAERNELEEQIEDLESRIIRVPQVERALLSLTRENESKVEQYNSIVSKTLEASMAESLEQGLKAERFSILESAVQPVSPFRPNRKKLLILALAFSIGAPVSVVLALGLLDKTIRNANVLGRIAKAQVIMDMQYVPYPGEMAAYRKTLILNFMLAFTVVVGLVLVVHFSVMPLPLLLDKVILRFSGGM